MVILARNPHVIDTRACQAGDGVASWHATKANHEGARWLSVQQLPYLVVVHSAMKPPIINIFVVSAIEWMFVVAASLRLPMAEQGTDSVKHGHVGGM